MKWIEKYGEGMDWDKDGIVPNGGELEEEHHKGRLKLTVTSTSNTSGLTYLTEGAV